MTGPARVKAPVETKVQLATATSVGGVALGTLAVWLLGVLVWDGPWTAAEAPHTLSLVPTTVTAVVVPAVTALATYVGGWLGKHTARPDLDDTHDGPAHRLEPLIDVADYHRGG